MTDLISDREKWRQVLWRQRSANGERWLSSIEASDEPAALVMENYDNLLRAVENALQNQETFGLAYRLIQTLSPIVFGYADWERWLIYQEKALDISRILERQIEQASLLKGIGNILYQRANYEQAKTLYQEAAVIYKLLGDLANYADVITRVASASYHLRGELEHSLALSHEAMQIGYEIEDEQVIASANDALSYIYLQARQLEEALLAAQTAYDHFKRLNKPREAASTLSNMVAIWSISGRWNEINEVSEELSDMLRMAGDVKSLANLKVNLGVAAYKQANYQLAESTWQEALRLYSQIQQPITQAHLYNNLGMVYTKMNEWDTAEAMLEKAIATYEQLGDKGPWANAMDNLADLYEAQGKLDECQVVLKQAVASLQDIAGSSPSQSLLKSMTERIEKLAQQK